MHMNRYGWWRCFTLIATASLLASAARAADGLELASPMPYAVFQRGLSAALRQMIDEDPDLFNQTRQNIYAAAGRVLDAAVASGAVEPVLSADDLVRAMSSICGTVDDTDHMDRATRLIEVLLNGMRTTRAGAR